MTFGPFPVQSGRYRTWLLRPYRWHWEVTSGPIISHMQAINPALGLCHEVAILVAICAGPDLPG